MAGNCRYSIFSPETEHRSRNVYLLNENICQLKCITSEHFSNVVRKTANGNAHEYKRGSYFRSACAAKEKRVKIRESKDVTQKNLEGFPDVAADILNVFIYGGRQVVEAERLYPAPTETEYAAPGAALRNQLEDVSKYEIQEGKIQVQYLLANQSEMDAGMILRRTGYVGAVYREQYDGKAGDCFPVVSLVLYWGEGSWTKACSIREFFRKRKLPPKLWKLVDDHRLHVFEMRNLLPEVRELFTSDMRLVVDYLAEGNEFWSDRPVVHKEALIRLLRALGGDTNVEDTAQILKEMNVKEEDEITMCELFDQYTRRGKKEGIKEGIEAGFSEGLQQGLNALISTCRELGVSFDDTAARVKEKFSLGDEETRKNMQLYW